MLYGYRYGHDWAETELSTARNLKAGKPVANNTRLFLRGSGVALRLHETDVVIYHPNGTYTLDSGGWRTMTTKSRITSYSPARVYSKRGVWYINDRLGDPVLFTDGMTVDCDGYPERQSNEELAAQVAHEAAVKDANRRVDEYVKGYIAELRNGMSMPGNGDCWGCLFANGESPLGTDPGHLEDHLEESYYVPSLAVNAIRESNYRDMAVPMFLEMRPDENTMGGPRGHYDVVARCLAKYLRKRLIPVA